MLSNMWQNKRVHIHLERPNKYLKSRIARTKI